MTAAPQEIERGSDARPTSRVGVIGVGGMGACHARNIADIAGAEVTWVADPDAAAGQALANELGTRWVADGNEMIDDCDALVVACPEEYHSGYVLAAVDRGLPVLCEKPLTVELAEARAIVDAETARGARVVQVGFMRQYDERHVQVANALTSLGEVNHVRCIHRNTKSTPRPVLEILVTSMVHDIHTVRWLSQSEIVSVSTSTVHRDGVPRMVVLSCRLDNGGVASIEFDEAATGYEVSVEVSAQDGNVLAAEPHRALIRNRGAVSSKIGDDWFSPFLDTYRIEMRDWLASIVAGEARGPSAWDGLAAQSVATAAAASEISGHSEAVTLPDRPAIYQGDHS